MAIINGTNGNDALVGTSGDDEINGLAGDDIVLGTTGNDAIDGGADYDTVRYTDPRSDFTVTVHPDGSLTVVSLTGGGTDTLTNVESVEFNAEVFAPSSVSVTDLDGADGFRLTGLDQVKNFDSVVGNADDINGDGIDDLIVGSAGSGAAGRAFVLFGTTGGFPATIDATSLDGTNGFRIDGTAAGDQFGFSVAGAGDLNHDGLDDFVVGAPGADPNGSGSGQTYVFYGKTGGYTASVGASSADMAIGGVDAGDQSGTSVAGADDVNGDGVDDLLIGAPLAGDVPWWRGGDDGDGVAYVVFGRSGGLPPVDLGSLDGTNGFSVVGESSQGKFPEGSDRTGSSVSGAGDVNNDGYADIIVGAPTAESPGPGAAYVVLGQSNGFGGSIGIMSLDGTNGFRILSRHDYSGLGWSVSGAGEFNGDGLDDLLVSDPKLIGNGPGRDGGAFVLFGTTQGFQANYLEGSLDGDNGFLAAGDGDGGRVDTSVSNAGDINDDGIDDFLVATRTTAFVAFGTPDGFPALLDLGALDGADGFKILGATVYSGLGVASGDFNGDGISDAVVDALNENKAIPGEVFVLFGRGRTVAFDNELLVGTPGDDVRTGAFNAPNEVFGLAGDDTLTGGAQGDEIEGDTGADVLNGLAGDDLLDGGDDRDTLNGGDGADVLNGGSENDVLNGGDGADIADGGAGNDQVNGLDGNDILTGGAGNDFVNGGGGTDWFDERNATDRVIVNLVNGKASGSEIGNDVLTSIERVLLGSGDDVIVGSDGSNVLNGDLGDDLVRGGGGDDFLIANPGDDRLSGEGGIDTFDASRSTAGVRVILEYDVASGPEIGTDALDTIENVRGGSGNDAIFGDAANNKIEDGVGDDYVDAGDGWDTVVASAGYDTLIGGPKSDLFDASAIMASINVDLGAGTAFGAQIDYKYLLGFERVVAGSGDDVVAGSGAANNLYGRDGDDTLTGLDGNDALSGNDGDDRLDGGSGADQLVGGSGDDVIVFDAADTVMGGDDRDIAVAQGTIGVVLDLVASEIEGVGGTEFDDVFTASPTTVDLVGRGAGGDDTITLSDGRDHLYGGDGNDVLSAGGGIDWLIGEAGADQLTGGAFNTDYFRYLSVGDSGVGVGNRDTILDFATGQDKFYMKGTGFTSYGGETNTFSAPNQLILDGDILKGSANGITTVFEIDMNGVTDLSNGDFIF